MTTRESRRASRPRRRPLLEFLEARTLLTVSPQVADVSPSVPLPTGDSSPGDLTQFDQIVGASAARTTFGVDGAGLSVAVIDTGVNYNHEALGGGLGEGHRVVGGHDFAEGDDDPFATTWQHGTAVAGLIASSDPAHPGVAPGAGIVALRVFGDDNKGDFDRIAEAMQWVIDHHEEYHISAVNLSISDGNNYIWNRFAIDNGIGQRITSLISQLRALNIPVVTAAGNNFEGQQGLGFTAIDGATISVTSTDGGDNLVANAQRLGTELGGDAATDLAAPGTGLTAPAEGDLFTTVEGTSFSTPLVTGAVVLLQQLYQSRYGHLPSVSDLEGWLKGGADTIIDGVTGISLGRLNIARAASLVPSPQPQVIVPEQPPTEPHNEIPAEQPHTTELIVDGHSTGTFNAEELSGQLPNLFPNFFSSLSEVHVWDNEVGGSGGNPFLNFDQLHVWSNESDGKGPGQTQPTGKVARARDLQRPLTWRGVGERRRRHWAFVRKDARS